ncbi:MAG: glucose 1-dehydrogenase [Hydrocarboniphaga sp.]|uniref:glucose 1-dehydrogenase n=1 Tax=Hydrocarboniphaga sp. TaxID=2033016 RepID=UPI002637D26F|nr:glucose 1-dehydrogenase [Hydrocarboniphaga sp.]MDB5972774.1 glucose 1-dehydrogenase [Hydrocarboniphaga sp.]
MKAPSNRLQDKVAIITGGARGMGAATVRMFVAEGAKVIITDVLETEGRALAAELGEQAAFIRHDVSDEAAWRQVLAFAVERYGRVDVLVNNAGILVFRSLLDTSKADFERVLSVNLTGTFLGLHTIAPHMIAKGRGSIVNISSIDGMKGANSLAAYASSKWGIRGLTKVAAMELGHRGLRVNSVHPGGIDTAMTNPNGVAREVLDPHYTMVPMQRTGAPEEVAAATLFLASDEASYINGAEIAVDGGLVIGQYYQGFPGAPGV